MGLLAIIGYVLLATARHAITPEAVVERPRQVSETHPKHKDDRLNLPR